MINIETAISNMYALMKKGITYSMFGSRTGKDGTGDCSGTIYDSLVKGGAKDDGWIRNTDSLHGWLQGLGFKLISDNKSWDMKRGDIIIFGKRGSSGNEFGHVVMAIDNVNVIHCNYGANGVSVNPESQQPYNMMWYVWRYEGKTPSQPDEKPVSNGDVKWLKESGRIMIKSPDGLIVSRETFPSLKSKSPYAFKNGEIIRYDSFCHNEGYVWVRQLRPNGKYWYIPIGKSDGKKRTSTWIEWI